uniref:RING-type domain-containing protein n=1 Tax=Caenorhabditis tropicalis TaxID=1561998 RepID=A0A1I7SYW2_9PELO
MQNREPVQGEDPEFRDLQQLLETEMPPPREIIERFIENEEGWEPPYLPNHMLDRGGLRLEVMKGTIPNPVIHWQEVILRYSFLDNPDKKRYFLLECRGLETPRLDRVNKKTKRCTFCSSCLLGYNIKNHQMTYCPFASGLTTEQKITFMSTNSPAFCPWCHSKFTTHTRGHCGSVGKCPKCRDKGHSVLHELCDDLVIHGRTEESLLAQVNVVNRARREQFLHVERLVDNRELRYSTYADLPIETFYGVQRVTREPIGWGCYIDTEDEFALREELYTNHAIRRPVRYHALEPLELNPTQHPPMRVTPDDYGYLHEFGVAIWRARERNDLSLMNNFMVREEAVAQAAAPAIPQPQPRPMKAEEDSSESDQEPETEEQAERRRQVVRVREAIQPPLFEPNPVPQNRAPRPVEQVVNRAPTQNARAFSLKMVKVRRACDPPVVIDHHPVRSNFQTKAYGLFTRYTTASDSSNRKQLIDKISTLQKIRPSHSGNPKTSRTRPTDASNALSRVGWMIDLLAPSEPPMFVQERQNRYSLEAYLHALGAAAAFMRFVKGQKYNISLHRVKCIEAMAETLSKDNTNKGTLLFPEFNVFLTASPEQWTVWFELMWHEFLQRIRNPHQID